MHQEGEHLKGHQTFLVTQDVGQKIETLGTVGIKTPSASDPFFDRLNDDLMAAVCHALGADVEVRSIKMSDLAKTVLSHAYANRTTEGSLIVSTCREFAEPMHGVTLDIHGNSLGIGPRPGSPPLEEQLQNIRVNANGRPVLIVEDGVFSGSTVQFVVDLCRKAGIKVNQVVVGFRFGSSQPSIDALATQDVDVSWVEEFGELLDWVPDHDFVPFVPNCGRILGVVPFDRPEPYYSRAGAAYSVPYVFPFAPVENWASIPGDAKRDLAKACLSLAQQVYTKLTTLNGREILIEEVLRAPQPVTLPFRIGASHPVVPGKRSVSDYLNELTHSVATDLYRGND